MYAKYSCHVFDWNIISLLWSIYICSSIRVPRSIRSNCMLLLIFFSPYDEFIYCVCARLKMNTGKFEQQHADVSKMNFIKRNLVRFSHTTRSIISTNLELNMKNILSILHISFFFLVCLRIVFEIKWFPLILLIFRQKWNAFPPMFYEVNVLCLTWSNCLCKWIKEDCKFFFHSFHRFYPFDVFMLFNTNIPTSYGMVCFSWLNLYLLNIVTCI